MVNAKLKTRVISSFFGCRGRAGILIAACARRRKPLRRYRGASSTYAVCDFDARERDVGCCTTQEQMLWLFARLADGLANKGEALVFAMNAGMYAEDRTPVGLYVENGRTLNGANTRSGSGNSRPRSPMACSGSTARAPASRQRAS